MPTSTKLSVNKKGFIPLILLIPLLLISGIVISGAFYLQNYSPITKSPTTNFPTPIPLPNISSSPTLSLSQIATSIKPSPTPSAPNVSSADWSIETSNSDIVEFSVSDSSGKTTGNNFADESYIQDLPNSTFVKQGGITDPTGQHPAMLDAYVFTESNPSAGIYTIKVFGIKNGHYHFGIGYVSTPPNPNAPKYIDGTAKANLVDTYTIDVPTLNIKKVN